MIDRDTLLFVPVGSATRPTSAVKKSTVWPWTLPAFSQPRVHSTKGACIACFRADMRIAAPLRRLGPYATDVIRPVCVYVHVCGCGCLVCVWVWVGCVVCSVCASFSLACGGHSIRLFDFFTGSRLARVSAHSELITGVTFTHDCRRLITVGADGCIMVWRISPELTRAMNDRMAELRGRSPQRQQQQQQQPPQPAAPSAAVSADGASSGSKAQAQAAPRESFRERVQQNDTKAVASERQRLLDMLNNANFANGGGTVRLRGQAWLRALRSL